MTWADEVVKIIESSKVFILILGILIGSYVLSLQVLESTTANPSLNTVVGVWLGMANTICMYYFFNRYNSTKFERLLEKLEEKS